MDELDLPLRGPSGEIILGVGRLDGAAFSPDGQTFATVGSMGVFLWDIDSGQPSRYVLSNYNLRNCITFSPNGQMLCVADNDGTLFVIDIETDEITHHYKDLYNVQSIAFSPDSRRLCVGRYSYQNIFSIHLFDLENGETTLMQRRENRWGGVEFVQFSPDGSKILSLIVTNDLYSSQYEITVFDVETKEQTFILQESTYNTFSVGFIDGGKKVLYIDDKAVRLADVETGERILKPVFIHNNQVQCAALSVDGKYLITGYNNWENNENRVIVNLWEIESGAQIQQYSLDINYINAISFSPDGSQFWIVSQDAQTIVRVDIETGQEVRCYGGFAHDFQLADFTPDGEYAVTTSMGWWIPSTEIFWDAETGEHVYTLFNDEPHLSLSFSKDGKEILTGENVWDEELEMNISTAYLLDTDTGEIIKQFEHPANLNAIELSPDEQHILAWYSENNPDTDEQSEYAILWNTETAEKLKTFIVEPRGVNTISFSPNGELLLTINSYGTAQVWNISDWEFPDPPETVSTELPLEGLSGETYLGLGSLDAVALSPDNQLIATGGSMGILVWDVETQTIVRWIHSENNVSINSILFMPDGLHLLVGTDYDDILVIDITTGNTIRKFESAEGSLTCLTMPDDSNVFIEGYETWDNTNEGLIRIRDLETGSTIRTFHEDYPVRSLSVTDDGRFLLASCQGYDFIDDRSHVTVRIWDTQTGEDTILVSSDQLWDPIPAALSRNGSSAVTIQSNVVIVWDPITGRRNSTRIRTGYVNAIDISPNGEQVVTAGEAMKLWNAESGKMIQQYSEAGQNIEYLCFSREGEKVLCKGNDYDNTVKLFDIETGQMIFNLEEYKGRIESAEFSADSRFILTESGQSDNYEINLWNPQTGEKIYTLETEWTTSATFSNDGKWILTGGEGIRLWKTETGELNHIFINDAWITSIAFSYDDRLILAGREYENTTRVELWDVETKEKIGSLHHGDGWDVKVAISPDNTHVLSSTYGITKLWDIRELVSSVAVDDYMLY